MAHELHELVTNAVKYGVLHMPEGRLAVNWGVTKHDGSNYLQLDWLETGVDIDLGANSSCSTGFGRYLIENGLPHQFGGKTSYEMAKDSVHCAIHVRFGNSERPPAVHVAE